MSLNGTVKYTKAVRVCGWRFEIMLLVLFSGMTLPVSAEKEMKYDPEKGIIFIEKKSTSKQDGSNLFNKYRLKADRKKSETILSQAEGLHRGRKKDPPKFYFKSGLEYFRNNDYENALKNFKHADSLKHRPEYSLFIGKTLRNLGRDDEVIKCMFSILKNEPESDVADDALLELAVLYKINNDYNRSTELFTTLIDQYPFGTEYVSGEELSMLARKQRRIMRAEVINMLSVLGITEEDMHDGLLAFQKKYYLSPTGIADRYTVNMLKQTHREFIAKEELRYQRIQQMVRHRGWVFGAIILSVLNVISCSFFIARVQAIKKQIRELSIIISEMDTLPI